MVDCAKKCNPPFCSGGHVRLTTILIICNIVVIRTEVVIQNFNSIGRKRGSNLASIILHTYTNTQRNSAWKIKFKKSATVHCRKYIIMNIYIITKNKNVNHRTALIVCYYINVGANLHSKKLIRKCNVLH